MEKINEFINEYSFESGIISIGLSLIFLVYMVNKNESARMSNHGLNSWNQYVNSWLVIILLMFYGIILLLKET
tara:strand:- start:334 stop:552 length:219 start_codon:yes stop_codon:yes gene_type:complete